MTEITITLNNFNLEEATIKIIDTLIKKHGGIYTLEQYADELGVNIRTLYRFKRKHSIIFPRRSKNTFNEKLSIKKLVEKGYIVTKVN